MRPSASPPRASDIDALLRASGLFEGVDDGVRTRIAGELTWFFAPGGTRVASPGQPCEELYLVLHGRLRVFGARDPSTGARPVVEELQHGGVLGDIEILGDGIHGFRVDAVRDTEVACLPLSTFREMADAFPVVWKRVAKKLLRYVESERSETVWRTRSTSVAIMPADPDAPLEAFAAALADAIGAHDSVEYVSSRRFAEIAGPDAVEDDIDEWDEVDREVMRRVESIERDKRFVIFETDAEFTPWTRRCMRQADRIFIVARSNSDPGLTEGEQYLFQTWQGSDLVEKQLVLLEPDEVERPSGSSDWLAWRPDVRRIYHVKLGEPDHIARLARFVTGRSVGVVFGGGGARGNAHIGVLEALDELGVPVDIVGGTSAGGGVAAMRASGRDVATMKVDSHHAFVEMAPFSAFDLPYASLMRKEDVDAPARWLYADLNIEDLWLPFFCVSVDVAAAEKVVHQRGRVWKAVRATTALPAVLPPVFLRGRILVDGGVVDNTPIEVMRQLNHGPNILVDVSPPEEDLIGEDIVDNPGNRDILLSLFHPLLKPRRVPSIASVIVRTMTVSSSGDRPAKLADLYLAPDVDGYSVVGFEAMDELVALGYNRTMEQFEAHRADPDFLAKFGLREEDLPPSLPRKEVPVWQSRERERQARRKRLVLQTVAFAAVGALLSFLVHSIVLAEAYELGALIGALLFGSVPPLRAALTRLERTPARAADTGSEPIA